jgi:nicotinate-nucleotide pyrophosphorylase (carboxylating)
MKDWDSFLKGASAEDPFYRKIFQTLPGRPVEAVLSAKGAGCLSGIPAAQRAAEVLGLRASWAKQNGDAVRIGEEIAHFQGTPDRIVKMENLVIGLLGKTSGIASAARQALEISKGRIHLVSGGWKKHPFPIKDLIREAVEAGGVSTRLVEPPFVYLDKNYVRIFGGIGKTLEAVGHCPGKKVIQLRGEFAPIGQETREAIHHGAGVVMVDTGSWEDLDEVLRVLREEKASPKAKCAFAGRIQLNDISALTAKGVDILDIGAAILDAPWLELSYDVVADNRG